MKLKLFFFVLAAFGMLSCNDTCRQVRTYRTLKPFQIAIESLKGSITSQAPRELKIPGKIYAYDKYLLISEVKKGIHIIDNSNPASPKNIAFVTVPGVLDMAVKDDVLYVDNYTDLVSLSISDPSNIKEIGRNPMRFNNGLFEGTSWYFDPYSRIITDFEVVTVTEDVKISCENGGAIQPTYYGGWNSPYSFGSDSKSSGGAQAAGGIGTGGSMARFTIYDEYLYAATQSDLLVFSIKNKTRPDSVSKVVLGWGIETIFPYQDKLFIGSNTGMHIYDNKDPKNPTRLSIFQHARACDPVVVEGNTAYVTLREGWCGVSPNRLDVVDIKYLTSPVIIKSYPMENPHGLSIDKNKLTICEGRFGLKTFDASNVLDIKIQQHIKDIQAYDVIQLPENLLIIIGQGGIFQYNNTNPSNLKLLSSILVNK
jgi:hypothetical protein